MTKKEQARLAAAIRTIADAPEAHALTVRAIVQALNAEFDINMRCDATGVIDLSGADYVARIGARVS